MLTQGVLFGSRQNIVNKLHFIKLWDGLHGGKGRNVSKLQGRKVRKGKEEQEQNEEGEGDKEEESKQVTNEEDQKEKEEHEQAAGRGELEQR